MKKLVILVFCLMPNLVFAKPQEFVREYTYSASENDSKVSARNNAVEQMNAVLLREIGQVVIAEQKMESASRSNEFIYADYTEKITAVTASMVKMEILKENWTGVQYYIRAKIVIDPSEVSKRANEVLLNQKEMKSLQAKHQDVSSQVDKLNSQLSNLRTQMQRNENFLFGEINEYKMREAEYLARINRLTEAGRSIGEKYKAEMDEYKAQALQEIEMYKAQIAQKDSALDTLNAKLAQIAADLKTVQGNAAKGISVIDDGEKAIKINTVPQGAFVYINDKYAGKSPHSYDNPPRGRVLIKVKLAGFEEYTWNINYAGGKQVLRRTLTKSP